MRCQRAALGKVNQRGCDQAKRGANKVCNQADKLEIAHESGLSMGFYGIDENARDLDGRQDEHHIGKSGLVVLDALGRKESGQHEHQVIQDGRAHQSRVIEFVRICGILADVFINADKEEHIQHDRQQSQTGRLGIFAEAHAVDLDIVVIQYADTAFPFSSRAASSFISRIFKITFTTRSADAMSVSANTK